MVCCGVLTWTPSAKNPGVMWLGHLLNLFLAFRGSSIQICAMGSNKFISLPVLDERSLLSISLPVFVIYFLDDCHSGWGEKNSQRSANLCFPGGW